MDILLNFKEQTGRIPLNIAISGDLYKTVIHFTLMNTKQLIEEYVRDHYEHFGFYPYDVEIDGLIYSYSQYWELIS